MSRSVTASLVLALVLLAALAVNRLDRTPRADRAVEIAEQAVRRPSATSPTCVLPDHVRRTCVVAEQSVTRPVLIGDVVVALTSNRAVGLDAESLEVRWTQPSSSTPSPIAARDDHVLLRDGTRLLLRDVVDGTVAWAMARPDVVWTSPDVAVVASVTDGLLELRDTTSGAVTWTAAVRSDDDVAVVGDRVAVVDQDPVTADQWRDVGTGEVVETTPVDGDDLPPAGRSALGTEPHATWAHRGSPAAIRVTVGDGRDVTAFTLETPPGGDPTQLVTDGRVVLVAFADRVEVHDVRMGTWLASFPALQPTVVSLAPLVVHGNGLLYRLDDTLLGT